MGWLIAVGLSGLTFAALYLGGKCSRLALEIVAAAVLLALAGYGWQGSPDMDGRSSEAERAAIARFELGDVIKPTTASRLREALEKARVQFVDDGPFAGAVFLFRAAG
ncbi:MAG: hypothetical protein H6916_02580 [Novosphingobium sp.]|uniref:hypothetical protein n=1 Tax=Novosphingobium sp. TaxID=1874826 RepID=UPI001D3D4AE1|nr:hypothetical protein [Novosphingobium sp.]MCB2057315.1 hypothetical protein [Novosphingobium sp.]MCP5385693.1 hypothetical protein [Novosphingobium sp.]